MTTGSLQTKAVQVRLPVLHAVLCVVFPLCTFAQTSPGGVLTSAACRMWVDAGDIDGDGDYTDNPALNTQVSNWDDKSGNNNDLTQGTAANRPTYNTVGGRPVVRWDNSGALAQWMNATSQAVLSPGTMYFVLRMLDAGDGGNCLWDRVNAGNTSVRYSQWNTTNRLGYTKYGTADYTSTLTSVYGSNVVVSYLKTAASNNLDIAINNGSVNLAVGAANPGLPMYVLGKNSTVDGMNGYVMEALVYNVALNYAQKMIVDNYLSAKHGGITIISDKYAGDTGGNGNYDYEMGGVGTEASGSNNQAAASITGGLQATQATAMENGEYLMYAHQSNPTNSVNTTDIGGMSAGAARGRWERIWYFDWTHAGGTNETVNLVFDYSDAGMGGSPAGATSNYKLLYRAANSGNWTEIMNASSIAGDQVTFNGVAWNTAGDGYYTIGSLNTILSPLPIELLSFEAAPCAADVCVRWSTSTEHNSHHFTVERSVNGTDWQVVGTVAAAGDSRSALSYGLVDDNPFPGISYYRIVTVDKDLSVQFSPVVAVIMHNDQALLKLYPNPASDEVNLVFASEDLVPQAFQLVSEDGRTIMISSFTINNNIAVIGLREYPKGVYLLMATLPNGTRLQRKMIVR